MMINEEMNYKEKIKEIRQKLIEAFGMPIWREPLPPVDELVSTILSQNTNDDNRDAAFYQLKEAFPDWEAVAAADAEDVVAAIRTAGLANQKGPRIQGALKEIKDHNGGEIDLEFLREMPREDARDWLLSIKGVGPKTAAIVLLFSMGIPAFPVDTHIYRVTGRIGIRPEKMNAEKAHGYLEERIPEDAYYDLHLNLIRLGREVCGARKWHCYRCPIEGLCNYDKKNLVDQPLP
ncbi:MAG: endonuclease III [Chloroflexota bacterium]|nr:endonuclease III [Chloroflexota bacterium]